MKHRVKKLQAGASTLLNCVGARRAESYARSLNTILLWYVSSYGTLPERCLVATPLRVGSSHGIGPGGGNIPLAIIVRGWMDGGERVRPE